MGIRQDAVEADVVTYASVAEFGDPLRLLTAVDVLALQGLREQNRNSPVTGRIPAPKPGTYPKATVIANIGHLRSEYQHFFAARGTACLPRMQFLCEEKGGLCMGGDSCLPNVAFAFKILPQLPRCFARRIYMHAYQGIPYHDRVTCLASRSQSHF